MIQETYEPHLNDRNLQTNFYVSLIVANILFGLMHPTLMAIAASGIVFFTLSVLFHLFSGQRPKA